MTLRIIAASFVLLFSAATPQQRYFRFERPLSAPLARAGQACVVADAPLFAHAADGLADVRLYHEGAETPYALELGAAPDSTVQPALPLNAGARNGSTVFDAKIPAAPYSDIQLELAAHDFIATVTVSGSHAENGQDATRLGQFTIFDFTKQHLGRSTVLHLPLSDFPFLHFSIAGHIAPGEITGLNFVRTPQQKPEYVEIAESAQFNTVGGASVAEIVVPANVPVERIVFVPAAEPAQFSRTVTVKAEQTGRHAGAVSDTYDSAVGSGSLLRVHSVHEGRRIDEENFAIVAPPVYGHGDRKWIIRVENGDDVPLRLKSVRLEMRQRRLCFDGAAGAHYALYYGDSALSSPHYDYATLFAAQQDAQIVLLGAESANPLFTARPDTRPLTERHPALLWVALVLVILALGTVALSSIRSQSPS